MDGTHDEAAGKRPASADQILAQVRLICGALLAGMVVLTALVVFLLAGGAFRSPGLPGGNAALLVVAAAAAGAWAAAPAVRRRLLEAAGRGSPDEVGARYTTATVVAFALREGPGLLGLVASLLAGSVDAALGFGAATATVMVLGWPRREELQVLLRRAGSGPSRR